MSLRGFMAGFLKKRRRANGRLCTPVVEWLEARVVPSAPTFTFNLNLANDEYGAQIQTVTQLGDGNRVVAGLLDTGASPITIASSDQAAFADGKGKLDPVPVKTQGGASGAGIGGSVTGNVSQPITVLTDGLHAANYDPNTFALTANFASDSAVIHNVQAFIGTDAGSPVLPTISGTPIFDGAFNSSATDQLAAKVDLQHGVDTTGFGILDPDVHFVPSTTRLTPPAGEELASIPLVAIGTNTLAAPGTDISSSYNFVSTGVQLNNTSSNQVYSLFGQKFLLDTGSQMTVISTAEANSLHIDLTKPADSISVEGVGGSQTVNGYIINSLDIRLAGLRPLTFNNVPVFVLDAAPGIDGILGMNLWNNVDQMLINPHAQLAGQNVPTLTISWDPNYVGTGGSGGPFSFELNGLAKRPTSLASLLGAASRSFTVPDQVPNLALSAPKSVADSALIAVSPGKVPSSPPVKSAPIERVSAIIVKGGEAVIESNSNLETVPLTALPALPIMGNIIVAPSFPALALDGMMFQLPATRVGSASASASDIQKDLIQSSGGDDTQPALSSAVDLFVDDYWLPSDMQTEANF